MKQYLCATKNMDYESKEIQELISERGWSHLDEYQKIGEIYRFVKEEIKFGYNIGDNIAASTVLRDGFGQCNTKACLLMTLLRAVGIPTRMHAFRLNHEVQKGVVPPFFYPLAPIEILHTWAEVWYEGNWIALEGVILDEEYIHGFTDHYCKENHINSKEVINLPNGYGYKGYGFGVTNLFALKLEWTGESTYVQSTGIIRDLGTFASADQCFEKHAQNLNFMKEFFYRHITRKQMNRRVNAFR